MGGICGTHQRDENVHTILVVKVKRRDHLEDPVIEGKIILKCMSKEIRWRYFDWV